MTGGGIKGIESRADEPERMLAAARELSLGGLVIALGIVVPILFHAIGSGPVFLPMHLPILAGAMLMSAGTAAMVGFLTPLASAAITGMPPISPPIAPAMAFELAAIATAASVLHRRVGLNPWLAAIGAIVCGRAIYAAELFVFAPLFGVHLPAAAAGIWALVKGWPGLVIQLAVVPPVGKAVESKGRGRG